MPTLGDGTVIPSHLDIETTPQYSNGDAFSNTTLRFGEVQRVIYPDDKDSMTGKFIEYDVYVQERSNGTGNGRLYKHCLLMSTFGGLADKAVFTLRGENSIKNSQNKRRGNGSKVLLLCINGETSNAVIIGGLRDQDDTNELDASDKKHHLNAVFNGMSFAINDDGEFTITFNGPTDIKGKLRDGVDQKTVGASITFTKDGKILVKENQALEIGDATDKMPLFSTYRDAEHNLNQSLQQGMTNASAKLNAAATLITSAVSPGPTPGAPIVACQSAGPLLLQAATELTNMAKALAEFEAKANQYLSKKNKND